MGTLLLTLNKWEIASRYLWGHYSVKGATEWMPGWKAKGWCRAGENAEPKNRVVMNVELWKAIDAALSRAAGNIAIRWVKGHSGVAGNERADQLAEKGRQEAIDQTTDDSILGRTGHERRSIFEYDV